MRTTTSRTRDELTEQAANAAIEQACRILHLPTIRAGYDTATQSALRHQASYKTYLADLLAGECDEREARRKIRAVKAACFPRLKRLAEFDFTANPAITPAVVHTLAGGEWIRQGRPLCLIGDSGTGKSHLLIGLGITAAENGHRVRYTTAAALANELAEAADDRQLTRTIARYSRIDLLCLDELGYLRLDRRGAELLFQVITNREEKSSIAIAIASNSTFSEWAATFTDPRLCAAIIETGTTPYRLTTTRKTTTPKTKP